MANITLTTLNKRQADLLAHVRANRVRWAPEHPYSRRWCFWLDRGPGASPRYSRPTAGMLELRNRGLVARGDRYALDPVEHVALITPVGRRDAQVVVQGATASP